MIWLAAPAKAQAQGLNFSIRGNAVEQAGYAFTPNGVEGITIEENEFSATRNGGQVGADLGAANVIFKSNRFNGLGSQSGKAVTLDGQWCA